MKLKLFLISVLITTGTYSFGQEAVPMKDYVDKQLYLMEEMNKLRDDHKLEISRIKDDNIRSAVATMEKRLDAINEFRGQLKDQASTFITRNELFAWVLAMVSLFFAFTKYMRDRQENSNTAKGKSIMSGDTVEVKK